MRAVPSRPVPGRARFGVPSDHEAASGVASANAPACIAGAGGLYPTYAPYFQATVNIPDLLELKQAMEAYKRALREGSTQQYARAAWRLYQAHGLPLGDSGRAMVIWIGYRQWTTSN